MSALPWGRLAVLLLAIVATAWWWGSTGADEPPSQPAATSSSTRATTPAPPEITPTTPASTATQAELSERAARTVLTTWARPHLDYHRWWADLHPLLTQDGRELLEYTDPSQIPPLKVTGPGVEDRGLPSPWATTWWFPTTEGRFGVDVARAPEGGPWLGFSIIFPGGESRRQG